MRDACGERRRQATWLTASLLIAALASGCHGDTNQGGGTDNGHAGPSQTPQVQQHVPTPPTADRIDPSSPQAVLDGTSTTQTTTAPKSPAQSKDRPASPR